MTKSIFLLPEAEKTFRQNVDYLSLNWSNQVINDFPDRVDNSIYQISINLEQYPFHDRIRAIRKFIITKRITLYFREKNNKIELLTFWNNYLDPNKR